MASELKGKKVTDSVTIMTELIMPNDTNPLGNLMGGNLMRWMDIAGGICAAKHCGNHVVTASVDHISFTAPIHLGDAITIEAKVTRSFNTSVEIYLEVFASDITGDNPRKSNHAFMTFVALNPKTKKPCPVPPVIPLSNEEQKLFESASRRKEIRLILAGKIKAEDANEVIDFFGNLPKRD